MHTYILPVHDAACSLLSMPRGKLISYLWDPDRPPPDLSELISINVYTQHHLVHYTCLRTTQECGGVTLLKTLCLPLQLETVQFYC